MVKNQGGNKGKRGARKLMVVPQSKAVREKDPKEPCEMYAAMVKLYGGAHCEVICEDGVTRICVIRSKFRGRGKQDNFMAPGVLILIGLRDWEVRHSDKKETCDLLCVYRDDEKTKLKTNSPGNWNALASATNPDEPQIEIDVSSIMFDDGSAADELLMKTIQMQVDGSESVRPHMEEDAINVDDI